MPPSPRSPIALTLAILAFFLVFFLGVACLAILFLSVAKIDGWRSILALIGASAALTTTVLALAVGALAMWFQLKVRAPEPPRASSPSGPPETSAAFSEDAAAPARRRRKKPPSTDETLHF